MSFPFFQIAKGYPKAIPVAETVLSREGAVNLAYKMLWKPDGVILGPSEMRVLVNFITGMAPAHAETVLDHVRDTETLPAGAKKRAKGLPEAEVVTEAEEPEKAAEAPITTDWNFDTPLKNVHRTYYDQDGNQIADVVSTYEGLEKHKVVITMEVGGFWKLGSWGTNTLVLFWPQDSSGKPATMLFMKQHIKEPLLKEMLSHLDEDAEAAVAKFGEEKPSGVGIISHLTLDPHKKTAYRYFYEDEAASSAGKPFAQYSVSPYSPETNIVSIELVVDGKYQVATFAVTPIKYDFVPTATDAKDALFTSLDQDVKEPLLWEIKNVIMLDIAWVQQQMEGEAPKPKHFPNATVWALDNYEAILQQVLTQADYEKIFTYMGYNNFIAYFIDHKWTIQQSLPYLNHFEQTKQLIIPPNPIPGVKKPSKAKKLKIPPGIPPETIWSVSESTYLLNAILGKITANKLKKDPYYTQLVGWGFVDKKMTVAQSLPHLQAWKDTGTIPEIWTEKVTVTAPVPPAPAKPIFKPKPAKPGEPPTIQIPYHVDYYSNASEADKTAFRELSEQYKALGPEAFGEKYGVSKAYTGGSIEKLYNTLHKYFIDPATGKLGASEGYVIYKVFKVLKQPTAEQQQSQLLSAKKKFPWGQPGYAPPLPPFTFPSKCPVETAMCAEAVDNIVEWRTKGHEAFSEESKKKEKTIILQAGEKKRVLPRALLDGTITLMKCSIPYAKHCKADTALVKENEGILSALTAKVAEVCKPTDGTYACGIEDAQNLLIDPKVSVNTALTKVHDMALSLIKLKGSYQGCKLAEEGKPSKHNMAYCQGAPNATLTGLNTIVQHLGIHKAEVWIEDTTADKAEVTLDYWDSVTYTSSHIRCAKVAEKAKELGMKCPITECPPKEHQHVKCHGEMDEGDIRQMAYFLNSIADVDMKGEKQAKMHMDAAWKYAKQYRDDKAAYKKVKHLPT